MSDENRTIIRNPEMAGESFGYDDGINKKEYIDAFPIERNDLIRIYKIHRIDARRDLKERYTQSYAKGYIAALKHLGKELGQRLGIQHAQNNEEYIPDLTSYDLNGWQGEIPDELLRYVDSAFAENYSISYRQASRSTGNQQTMGRPYTEGYKEGLRLGHIRNTPPRSPSSFQNQKAYDVYRVGFNHGREDLYAQGEKGSQRKLSSYHDELEDMRRTQSFHKIDPRQIQNRNFLKDSDPELEGYYPDDRTTALIPSIPYRASLQTRQFAEPQEQYYEEEEEYPEEEIVYADEPQKNNNAWNVSTFTALGSSLFFGIPILIKAYVIVQYPILGWMFAITGIVLCIAGFFLYSIRNFRTFITAAIVIVFVYCVLALTTLIWPNLFSGNFYSWGNFVIVIAVGIVLVRFVLFLVRLFRKE